ncbi:MAG: formate dehydrogenase accessory sulfurtransferase FdhD [Myxococcota bacterium]
MTVDPDEAHPHLAAVERVTWNGPHAEHGPDLVVREEPLEIRVNGVTLGVLMRTPGDEEALVRGFLLSEGVAQGPEEIRFVRPCSVSTPESEGNVYLATLAEGVDVDLQRFRRGGLSTSSCGVCGKATLEQAMEVAPPLPLGPHLDPRRLRELPATLAKTQVLFEHTGGLHAAAGFTAEGELLSAHEDIGRHNAVDKVIGSTAGRGRRPDVLVVSSRLSFEIAQKALAARIPAVVAVSAPSALAVELGRAAGLTVVAFARGDRMVVYADPGRIRPEPEETPP